MLIWLLLLFTCIPILELFVLIRVGTIIGPLQTILLVLVTGVVGAWMARNEGRDTLRRIRNQFNHGRVPSAELQDGLIILFSGALLLTPGLITDTIGFLGLLPLTRPWLKRLARSFFKRNIGRSSSFYQVEWHRSGEEESRKRSPEWSRTEQRADLDFDIDITPDNNSS